jgi:hypothetical protein
MSNKWREWESRNCKLTGASSLVYLSPALWLLLLQEGWTLGCLITVPIGIWRSHGTWRRVLSLVFFLAILVSGRWNAAISGQGFVPWPVAAFWLCAFYATWYADGQEHRRSSRRPEWD